MKIKDLEENKEIDGIYLISNVTQGVTGTGAPYLNITLQDATGNIEAKKWSASEADIEFYKARKIVHIKGMVISHNGKLQVKILSENDVNNEEIDIQDYVASSPISQDILITEFKTYQSMIKNKDVRRLVDALINKYYKSFLEHPAATRNHHEYCSGLLQHSVYCAKLCLAIASTYDDVPGTLQVDKDILVAGALLHDLGKIKELSGPIIAEYTVEGRLLGHISIMNAEIKEMADKLNIEGEIPLLLEHMILSHHGQHEFGSPVLPMTKEALILSIADNIDAKLNMLDKELNNVEEGTFTTRIFPLENRSFYRPKTKK